MPGFAIDVQNLCWIGGSSDDPDDLCAHGDVTVTIGACSAACAATVSATALYLMKTLERDHTDNEIQLIPCCGHTLIADAGMQNVQICGCPEGVDWDVLHDGNDVLHCVPDEPPVRIPLDEYREIVFAFADKVAAFYRASSPKVMPQDDFDARGWLAFQREWRRRRGRGIYG